MAIKIPKVIPEDDSFPAKQLASLGILPVHSPSSGSLLTLFPGLCRLAEPIAFISIVAYTFPMVREIKGEEDASFYAGLLVSAFAIAEASTAMIWGTLSDRYGRKPIILLGLTGTALSSLLLGFAKNYWVAFLARVLGGLLNGNVAVMQTMVAEMVKNPKHEPRAYSVQPFMWSLGSIAGSALGGYASQPARFYPHFFSHDGIFDKYPYLLPNLIAVIVISIAIIQASIFLNETNPRRSGDDEARDNSTAIDEYTPLRRTERRMSAIDIISTGQRRLSYVAGSVPAMTEPGFDVRRSSFGSISSFQPLKESFSATEPAVEEIPEPTEPDTPVKAFNKTVILWIIAIALMCYHQMAFVSVFPIYLQDSPRRLHQLDLLGGLGMTVHDVGRYMAVNSAISLFTQAVIFPFFIGKLGVWKSIVSLTIFCPLVDVLLPFVSALPRPGWGIYFALALQSFCTIIIYPSLLIMLKNATPSPTVLGKVNGLAISASSAARTVAPPLIGIFYSTFGSAGAWWSCAAFAAVAIVELAFIPRLKEGDGEILRKASMRVEEGD